MSVAARAAWTATLLLATAAAGCAAPAGFLVVEVAGHVEVHGPLRELADPQCAPAVDEVAVDFANRTLSSLPDRAPSERPRLVVVDVVTVRDQGGNCPRPLTATASADGRVAWTLALDTHTVTLVIDARGTDARVNGERLRASQTRVFPVEFREPGEHGTVFEGEVRVTSHGRWPPEALRVVETAEELAGRRGRWSA